MIKVFQKIILLIAVITVTAHSIFPHIHFDDIMAIVEEHHHHDELQPGTHHHNDNDSENSQRNVFSLAQLDDDFIPGSGHYQSVEFPGEYIPAIIICQLPQNYPSLVKTHFGWYIEYPPPDDYRYNLPSRAPPAIV